MEVAPVPVPMVHRAMNDREAQWKFHRPERSEIAYMVIDLANCTIPANEMTRATEDDQLPWRSDTPENVEFIRSSPEWKLIHQVWRGWCSPPGTSDRSCLLPQYDGVYKEDGLQKGDPVPHGDEYACKAVMQWFMMGRTCQHRVLHITTSWPRTFTCGMSYPETPNSTNTQRIPMVSCSPDGQSIEALQTNARLVYRGPLMPVGTKFYKEQAEWWSLPNVMDMRDIYLGHGGGESEGLSTLARQQLQAIPKFRMLTREFWVKP